MEPEPVSVWVYDADDPAYGDAVRRAYFEREEARLQAEKTEGGTMRTFNLDRSEDRAAFDVEAREVAKAEGLDYGRACRLLAERGRVSYGEPRPRTFDTNDPKTREALAAEAKRRIGASRAASITACGDESKTALFSDVLAEIVMELQRGGSVAGIEAKEESCG